MPTTPRPTWPTTAAQRHAAADEARRLPRPPLPWSARIALIAASAGWLAVAVACVLGLPERVPMHWGVGPVPDRWGGRPGALALLVFLPLATVGVSALLRLGSFSPEMINMPEAAKDHWYAHPDRVLALNLVQRTYAAWFAAAMLLFCAGISGSVLLAAHHPDGHSPAWSGPLFLAWLATIVAETIWFTRTLTAPARESRRTPR